MRTSLLVLLLLSPQDPPETLVRRLGSDSLAERDGAERALRALGAPALPALDAAGKDADGEIAVRAGRIARAIRLLADAPPALFRRFPQAAERISAGGDAAWVSLALEASHVQPPTDEIDLLLRYLVPRALRGRTVPDELRRLLGLIEERHLVEALPDAIPLLLHPDDDVSDAAFDAVREFGSPSTIRPLLDLAAKADAPHRETAVRLLAQLHHPDSVAACLGLLGDGSPEVRRAALTGLRDCPGRAVREAVESRLSDRDDAVRSAAVRVLASLQHPSSLPRFRELLADPDEEVREAALDGLARLRIPGTEPSLLPLLADPDEDVRRSALGALTALRSPAAGREIVRRLREGDADDADQCLRWLQVHPVPGALPALLERMKTLGSDDHSRVVEILKRDGGAELAPVYRAIAADEKDPRRLPALELLAGAAEVPIDPAALRALRDPAVPVRLAVIRGLAGSDRPVPAPDLRPLLRDSDPTIRRWAVWSLRALPAPDRLPLLLEALKDDDSGVVESAVSLLSEEDVGDIRAPLWAVVDGAHEEDARRQALRVALQLSGPGDAAALLPRLADPVFGPSVFEMLPELGLPADRIEEAFGLLERAKEEERCTLLSSLSNYDLPSLAPRLKPFLRSASPTERIAAIEAVSGLRAWSLVPEVAALTEDPVADVRRSAFSVLNTLDAVALYPAARKRIEAGDVELRSEAMSVLLEDESPETRAFFRTLLDHPSPAIAVSALEALGALGDESAVPRLLDRVRLGNAEARRSAMRVLVDRLPAGASEFQRWLQDPVEDLRRLAARGAGRAGGPGAAAALREALEDPEPEVVRQALEALAELGAPEAAAAAAERLGSRDSELRHSAVRALLRADFARGRAALLELLEDPDVDVRQTALQEAAASGDDVLRERVVALLRDPSVAVRRSAAYQAGAYGIRSARPALIRLLESGERSDRFGAIHALGALGDPEAAPALRRALAGTRLHWNRRSIAYALALCGDPAGVPLLLRGRASFLTLNAVRRPEQWRRLRDLAPKAPLRGLLSADLKVLAETAGLALEVSEEAARVQIRRPRSRFEGELRSWSQGLLLACSWDVVPVLEEKTLRVLSRAEAREFFGAWWEAESKRLEER